MDFSEAFLNLAIVFGSFLSCVAYFLVLLNLGKIGLFRDFKIMVQSLAVADACNLIPQALLSGFVLLAPSDWSLPSLLPSMLIELSYQAIKYHTVLIGLNRFGALVWGKVTAWLFEERRLLVSVALCWIGPILMSIVRALVACNSYVYGGASVVVYDCGPVIDHFNFSSNQTMPLEVAVHFLTRSLIFLQFVFDDFTCVLLLLMIYTWIFSYLRYQRSKSSLSTTDQNAIARRRKELFLLAQGWLIGVWLLVPLVPFYGCLLAQYEFCQSSYFGLVVACGWVVNSGVNPCLMLIFNGPLRKEVRKSLNMTKTTKVSTTSQPGGPSRKATNGPALHAHK